MTDIQSKPEVQFRVGPIRVTIWTNPQPPPDRDLPQDTRRVTIEHDSHPQATAATLGACDIPQAVLALRKAHDYLQNTRGKQTASAAFETAEAAAPERLP